MTQDKQKIFIVTMYLIFLMLVIALTASSFIEGVIEYLYSLLAIIGLLSAPVLIFVIGSFILALYLSFKLFEEIGSELRIVTLATCIYLVLVFSSIAFPMKSVVLSEEILSVVFYISTAFYSLIAIWALLVYFIKELKGNKGDST